MRIVQGGVMKNSPRVCFLYECRFRNDGSPVFLRMAFKKNWKTLGLLEPAGHLIPGHHTRSGDFDLYVWPDHGEDGLPIDKVVCPKPNIYWCSDSHLGLDYRVEKAREFDVVCVTISEHVDLFKKQLGHENVFWVPHAGEPTCYSKHEIIKKYDLCFIGHIPNNERADMLDTAFNGIENIYWGQKFFEEAAKIYSSSKIVFNHSISKEANMRSFEATLTGSMMLTNYSLDLEKLGYQDREHCVYYNKKEDIPRLVRYYLDHEEEREAIAAKGMELTLNKHTYLHRAKQIMDIWREYARKQKRD